MGREKREGKTNKRRRRVLIVIVIVITTGRVALLGFVVFMKPVAAVRSGNCRPRHLLLLVFGSPGSGRAFAGGYLLLLLVLLGIISKTSAGRADTKVSRKT